ncbi:hypothetical protein BC941DRAFT_425393 [Chlamydoabsidia padenii]|nr:hypothetical protein BC941DRAFT_425393 [Chlamydoabsidia padenii]
MDLMKSSGSHDNKTNSSSNNNNKAANQKDDQQNPHPNKRTSFTSSPSYERHGRSMSSGTSKRASSLFRRPTMNNNTTPTTTSLQRSNTTTTSIKHRQVPTGGRKVYFNLLPPSPASTNHNNNNNNKLKLFGRRAKKGYVTNKIRTSKYTWWTFVPKNLFEQFRRAANMYFLAMAIIQLLPYFGVKSPALTLLPICAVVFISGVKDGFEDYQRHKVDARYNGTPTHILLGYNNPNYDTATITAPATNTNTPRPVSTITTPTIMTTADTTLAGGPVTTTAAEAATDSAAAITIMNDDDDDDDNNNNNNNNNNKGYFGPALSKDVRVGDILLLRNGESCPADCVLLSTSDDESGICFVETKDLDGETNLKPRTAVPPLMNLQSGHDCLQQHFYVECNAPSPDLYTYEGTLVLLDKKNRSNGGTNHDDTTWHEVSKTPLSIDHLILRGHVVRNTSWALVVVVFTGTDTKIMLNSGETPSKRSQIEREMNSEVLIAFGVLMILCLVCAIMCGVDKYRDDQGGGTDLYSKQDQSPAFVGFTNFWSSLIIFQNIIPISLYVSIEFVKTFQAYFIWSDLDMWDEESKSCCIPKSWNLSDDLGQIEYLFSDKTGTLTRNIMEFRECTVDGQRYGNNGFAPETEGARGARLRREQQERRQQQTSTIPLMDNSDCDPADSPSTATHSEKMTAMQHLNHNAARGNSSNNNNNNNDDDNNVNDIDQQRRQMIMTDYKQALFRLFTPKYASTDPSRLSFVDPRLMHDLADDGKDDGDDSQSRATHAAVLKEFFTLLAVCHTVVVERIGKDGKPIVENPLGETNQDDTIRKPQVVSSYSMASMDNNVGSDTNNDGGDGGANNKKKLKWRPTDTFNKKRRQRRGDSLDAALSQDDDENDQVNLKRLERVDPTVQDQLDYKAESPDEAALVLAARNAGFAFTGRQGNRLLTVDILGQSYTFELLHVFAFTSTRKRMSVIVRRPAPWNDTVLYCKGADNVMFSLLDQNLDINKARMAQTQQNIDNYSSDGLRTLVLAYRTLDDNDAYFQQWQLEMKEASTAMEGRMDKINRLQDELEQGFTLLGATAIEDKLQEGVPSCIEDLRLAGMKIWVLTGDKLETAINIGYASNLLDSRMKLWIIRSGDNDDDGDDGLKDGHVDKRLDFIRSQLDKSRSNQQQLEHALVIEGGALAQIYETEEYKSKLLQVALQCKSVVCCRVSPLQKALVVELVRRGQGAVTLAVGDGANDVSMIQAANVGVGIAGQEGVQASMAADYSIAQFRFLRKLLLVQGHWSYERISEMILNFFFKNVIWVFPALWYQIYSRFSGNLFYDYSFIQLYNLLFTVAPIIILGTTDQDITSAYLQRYPQVYQIGVEKKIYNKLRFWIYFMDGIWQSVIVFYGFYFLYNTNPNPTGYPDTWLQFSTSVAVTAIILANIMPGFNTYYWTWWQIVGIGLELVVALVWLFIYGAFPSNTIYGMATMVFGGWSFWLTFLMVLVMAFLPRYTCTFVVQWWYPDVMHQVRHVEMDEKRHRKASARHRRPWYLFGGNRGKKVTAKQPA